MQVEGCVAQINPFTKSPSIHLPNMRWGKKNPAARDLEQFTWLHMQESMLMQLTPEPLNFGTVSST